jgi:two-component system, NtrC family, response regulator PilR
MSISAAATGLRESGDTLRWTEYPKGVPVLVVDDDVEVRTLIGRSLRKFKVEIVQAGSLAQARRLLSKKTQQFSLVFLDKCLPDGDGVKFWQEIRSTRPDLSCAIITGLGSAEEAHLALEDGVFDYIPKPIAISKIRSVMTTRYPGLLKGGDGSVVVGPVIDGTDGVEVDGKVRFIAHSSSMISVSIDVTRIAKLENTPVAISGDTGCGKEVVARLIHERSSRANQKFVGVNCGAIPDSLIESSFFGHRKGSFTGAYSDRKGFFEEADGGTIFLDEIAETSPAFQVKLLRVLQEGCITPLGSAEEIKVDVRVIAATNRDLRSVDSSGLRKDLYYRLKGCDIYLPPLKDRPEDIIPLAFYFALQVARKAKKKVWFSVGLIDALKAYSWPGNVRELSQVITAVAGRAVDRVENIILVSDLPESLRIEVGDLQSNEIPVIGISEDFKTLAEVEEEHILKVLRAYGGNMSKAARVLGREPSQFGKLCRSKGWVAGSNDIADADE